MAAVHLAIAAHIVHWRVAGTTLSSVQLSDAGRLAADGVVTAAFLLFAALMVATAVFGRFFCAWGCHMLALQEACRFALQRLGVRPILLRSRLLPLIPVLAALHLFVEPAAQRAWYGVPSPDTTLALATDELWSTLPGSGETIAILACGALLIYLLGSLSVCKYVCPYGAVLALADGLAPGRIRRTGDCDGCGRCTAACTTGVLVHEEVQRLAMVADSGCMRCFECVAACPRRVLAYRFGRPPLHLHRRDGLRRFSFSRGEDLLMLGTAVVGFVCTYRLYDRVPFVVALAASSLVGYLAVIGLRLVRRPSVALRGVGLKRDGRLSRSGVAAAVALLCVFAGVAHSGALRLHAWRGEAALTELSFPRLRASYSPAEQERARAAARELEFGARYGLVDTVDTHLKLAWLGRVLGDSPLVENHLRRAIALDPGQPAPHFNLAKELLRQGRRREAARAFAEATRLAPELAQLHPGSAATQ